MLKKIWHSFIKILTKLRFFPPLFGRVSVGALFVSTGWGKVTHIEKIIDYFTSLGIPAPAIQAPLAAGAELACGALLFVGLLSRVVSIPLIVIMIVALMTAKAEDIHGFFDLVGQEEFLIIIVLTSIIVEGPGRISLDHLAKKKFD